MKTSSSSSSISLLGLTWLLFLCVTPGSRGQDPSTKPQLGERDALCYEKGCYAVFLQKKAFRDAGRSCREKGGTLATMHDYTEAGVVHDLLFQIDAPGRSTLRLWVGLHRPPRQCSATRPLRGFVWVTGDQDGQYTNWMREETPGTCAAHRCVAMTVHTLESTHQGEQNYQWLDGSCSLALDGYVCQYNYKGMCSRLGDEGKGPAVYTTPFNYVSPWLKHIPYGSVATLPCPPDSTDPEAPTEQTVLCMERDDQTVGWSRDAPLCSANTAPDVDWCSRDHGCEHFCENSETDYYCYCSDGFILDEDGYSCKPDPLSQTTPPELSSDSAGPTEQPHLKEVCVDMGCAYDCVETPRGVRCICPPGYQMGSDGRECKDVDECQQEPCQQLCVNIPGTFHCSCHPGYQQDDEGECVDVDECLDENSCEGSCENTVGSFSCQCTPGYELSSDGECSDIDECKEESPCQQQCLNFLGGYQCFCDEGFDLESDGLTCTPSKDDEEYSSLTPDPIDSVHEEDLDPNADLPWSTSFTPDVNFEVDTNFGWFTESPDHLFPNQGSDNDLNQLDVPAPYHTVQPPTQKYATGNEIGNESKPKANTHETGAKDASVIGKGDSAQIDTPGDVYGTAASESTQGRQKQDKSWLLVALLVPLCVFLVVMLALGIVYCTSCAVDKSLSFSDCYRWILPTTPPAQSDGKPRA
ncbi:endosialin-like [Boleophthalmus pectinirostris]|uniref:endosialin-like n=1 Tax=Boleophthalmus pectinirostris TaxID=150288 RepID=UPI002430A5E7|nr:endosialin-like [Boleophthalmus pectinirostris]